MDVDETIMQRRGDFFTKLIYANAEKSLRSLRLGHPIKSSITRRRISHVAALNRVEITQPTVSALTDYFKGGFLVRQVIEFLKVWDCEMAVAIRKKPRSRDSARICILAAARGHRA